MDGLDSKLFPAKRIKQEPPDLPVSTFAYDEYGVGSFGDHLPPAKHSASPAQEATRARINTLESQLNRLYRLQSVGKLDHKGVFQIRCLDEDLRKAHSKLRRLLNEAERQRRRRERLRSCSSVDDAAAATVLLHHGYPTRDQSPDDQSIMAALRGSAKFEDFVRELRSLGFSLARMKDQPHVFDIPEDSENGADEVKVQVELIEGDVAFESNMTLQENEDIEEIKLEHPLSPQHSEDFLSNDDPSGEPDSAKEKDLQENRIKLFADEYARKHALYISEWQSQHQDWFERQVEAQQQWEENFVRKQMELAKSILESSTTAFLQGIQQVMQNIAGQIGRRPVTPFCPTIPRNFDFSHYSSSSFSDHQTTLNSRLYSQTNSKLNGRTEK